MPLTSAAARSEIARSSDSVQTRSNASDKLLLQPSADLLAVPEQPAEILHPFEVRHGDPAGIREHVGEHRNPTLGEDRVRLDRRRAVRPFGDEPGLDPVCVLLGELVLAGSEREDVARQLEQLRVRHVSRIRVIRERAVLVDPCVNGRQVESVLVHDTARQVGHGDHAGASRRELARGDAADVAEALHHAPLVRKPPAESSACAVDHHHDADAGRLVPEHGATDRDRLARDDLRDGVALLHRVRVHHPRHGLLVRRHVGCRDVLLRADDVDELGGVAPCESLQLRLRHLTRIAAHAALRAAVRQPQAERISTSSTSQAQRTRRGRRAES